MFKIENLLTFAMVALAIMTVACGDYPSMISNDVSALVEEDVDDEGNPPWYAEDDSEVRNRWLTKEFEVQSVGHPCDSQRAGVEYDDLEKPLTLEKLHQAFEEVKECDPGREHFDISGQLREGWYEHSPRVHNANTLLHMQAVANNFVAIADAFEDVPVLQRRAIVEKMAPMVAEYVVMYLHEDHINEWLLELDWASDIEPINPEWYMAVDWPGNRKEKVSMPDSDMKLSKAGLWVRMFWKRRGEALFDVAKENIQAHMHNAGDS